MEFFSKKLLINYTSSKPLETTILDVDLPYKTGMLWNTKEVDFILRKNFKYKFTVLANSLTSGGVGLEALDQSGGVAVEVIFGFVGSDFKPLNEMMVGAIKVCQPSTEMKILKFVYPLQTNVKISLQIDKYNHNSEVV